MSDKLSPSEQQRFFELLDAYARNTYSCFVAEFFPGSDGTSYVTCFRPLHVTIESPNRWACKYLQFETEQLRAIEGATRLPSAVLEILDNELPLIPQD